MLLLLYFHCYFQIFVSVIDMSETNSILKCRLNQLEEYLDSKVFQSTGVNNMKVFWGRNTCGKRIKAGEFTVHCDTCSVL